MKNVKIVISCFLVFTALFLLQKPLFLLFHWELSVAAGFWGCIKTVWHGLTMDMSVAAYCTMIPAMVLLISLIGGNKRVYLIVLKVYFIMISVLVSAIFICDTELYTHWGFRIDATVFTYIVQPKEAAASVSFGMIVAMGITLILWSIFQYITLNQFVVKSFRISPKPKKRGWETMVFAVLFGLLFVTMRGGVTASTMNISRAYFSETMFLNHAAVNPCFSMLSSMAMSKRNEHQYSFMDADMARLMVSGMVNQPATTDSIPLLLNTTRPNIIFIILESFGAAVVESLGGAQGVTPHISRLSKEGVFFSNMYAGSFRTDRGLVCILSGYPAQPTMSITKYPAISQSLQSIPSILKKSGYNTSFLYGGDLNFAYIKSYLVTQGIVDFTQDSDFPVKERLSKWGVPDHTTFESLYQQIKEARGQYCTFYLTLSSHEPFQVPFNRFQDPYLNSVAYSDDCLGLFIERLKQLPQWENLLVVLVPDHAMKYPTNISYDSPERHRIFSLWMGGAIRQPMVIDQISSQTDIAATLLGQLGIDYAAMPYSRNILHPQTGEYAFYAFPNGFGMVSPQGFVVYDCDSKSVTQSGGINRDSLLLKGKAYLQCSYNDIVK
jgi:phosphoglycerol transferase MdoB-like AlkP superfamily enzyme